MAEIRAVPWNGFNCISTFSGCGGSSLGYKLAGFRVLWANEFIPAAQEVYSLNHPDTKLDRRDIREIKPAEILRAIKIKFGELDLLDGSPPCASFSKAGHKLEQRWNKVRKYSDTEQRTDDLFGEFTRLLAGLRPRVFVAENVAGLVRGVAKGYFVTILAALKECGYKVVCRVVDAQWLGVPQVRKRTIFVGVREDLRPDPAHPEPLPWKYSLEDALEGLDTHRVEPEADIARFAIGSEWDKLAQGGKSKRYYNLDRASWNRPCQTICASHGRSSAAGVTHPSDKRKFSIAELKRICGFPDDFALTGTYEEQWERLGRAVPPVMMGQIAATVRDKILTKL